LLNISQLWIEEITERLKAADDVKLVPPQAVGWKLFLIKEQCPKKYKKLDSGRGGSSSDG